MTTCLYPGSFDPPTLGHIDIVSRAQALFDHCTIGVASNALKKTAFSIDQRIAMWNDIIEARGWQRVSVCAVEGLVSRFCADNGIDVAVKGVRNEADVTSEMVQSIVNRNLSGIDTVFLPCRSEFIHVSSTIVKDIAQHRGCLSGMVDDAVESHLRQLYGPKHKGEKR